MQLYLLLLTTGALVIADAPAAFQFCDYRNDVAPGQTRYVYSLEYPQTTKNATNCRWELVGSYEIILNCSVDIPYNSNNCADGRLSVSTNGDASMSNAQVYCGNETFTLNSKGSVVITYITPYNSNGGKFLCEAKVAPKPRCCECKN